MLQRTLPASSSPPQSPPLNTGERRLHRLTESSAPACHPAVAPALVPLSSCSCLPARRSRTTPRVSPSAPVTSTPHLHRPSSRYPCCSALHSRIQPTGNISSSSLLQPPRPCLFYLLFPVYHQILPLLYMVNYIINLQKSYSVYFNNIGEILRYGGGRKHRGRTFAGGVATQWTTRSSL